MPAVLTGYVKIQKIGQTFEMQPLATCGKP